MSEKFEKFKKWFIRRKYYVSEYRKSLVTGHLIQNTINPFEMFQDFENDLVTISLLNDDESSEEKIKEIIGDVINNNPYDRIMTENREVYSTYGVVDKIYDKLKEEDLIK